MVVVLASRLRFFVGAAVGLTIGGVVGLANGGAILTKTDIAVGFSGLSLW